MDAPKMYVPPTQTEKTLALGRLLDYDINGLHRLLAAFPDMPKGVRERINLAEGILRAASAVCREAKRTAP